MRHLVLAIVMAAGVSLVGSVAASAAPANGQAISQAVEKTNQITPGHARLRTRLASQPVGTLPSKLTRSFSSDQ